MTLSSRQLAIRGGLPRYFGVPCTKGHSGVRYTANCKCVVCDYENGKKRPSKTRQKKLAQPEVAYE